ncbi:MAG TPA: hypothetical protein VGN51_19720 [Acidimicrobiia bacterium]|jgi:hypothetical protein
MASSDNIGADVDLVLFVSRDANGVTVKALTSVAESSVLSVAESGRESVSDGGGLRMKAADRIVGFEFAGAAGSLALARGRDIAAALAILAERGVPGIEIVP